MMVGIWYTQILGNNICCLAIINIYSTWIGVVRLNSTIYKCLQINVVCVVASNRRLSRVFCLIRKRIVSVEEYLPENHSALQIQ